MNSWPRLLPRLSIRHVVMLGALLGSAGFGACDEPCGNLCVATNEPKAWPEDPLCIQNEAGDEYCANDCERCLRKVVGRLGTACLDQSWTSGCAKMATMICGAGACRGN